MTKAVIPMNSNAVIPVNSKEEATSEHVMVIYDRTNIAPNPFKQMDYDRDSIMREIEGRN